MNQYLLAVLILIFSFQMASPQNFDTLRVDAVELLKGNEVAGKAEYSATHYQYVYFFINQENQKLFQKNPERYQIQLGGACGRMGLLSGKGRTDLFTVYDNKLYIFASESCRKTFLAGPEKVLEKDDPPPETTVESIEKGKELLKKVLSGLGGEEKLDALQSFQRKLVKQVEYQGENVETVDTETIVFPDKARFDNTWAQWKWGMFANQTSGYFISSSGLRPMEPVQKHAFEKLSGQEIIYLLKVRNQQNFSVSAAGKGKSGPGEVEFLKIFFNGQETTFGIHPKTGRVLSLSYRGQGPNMFIGKVEKFYSDFLKVGDLILPMTVSGKFDGEIIPSWSKTFTEFITNQDYPDSLFSVPSK